MGETSCPAVAQELGHGRGARVPYMPGLVIRAPAGPGNRHFLPTDLARLFVLTLVPIAIAYHLAHYLAYLLVAGQFIIRWPRTRSGSAGTCWGRLSTGSISVSSMHVLSGTRR